MKTVGLIGGIGPESTIAYYRAILARLRELRPDAGAPSVIINSIDVGKLLALVGRGELDALTDYLLPELDRLARAGCDFAALASNTPHIVFDRLQRESTMPLLSIVEATCDAVAAAGVRRVALFGTKFTMRGGFYADGFAHRGIDLVLPAESDQELIHAKYVGELLENVFSEETRAAMLGIVDSLREAHAIEGVVLGGTELPLLLTASEHAGIPFFDTTKIHVERIVAEL